MEVSPPPYRWQTLFQMTACMSGAAWWMVRNLEITFEKSKSREDIPLNSKYNSFIIKLTLSNQFPFFSSIVLSTLMKRLICLSLPNVWCGPRHWTLVKPVLHLTMFFVMKKFWYVPPLLCPLYLVKKCDKKLVTSAILKNWPGTPRDSTT